MCKSNKRTRSTPKVKKVVQATVFETTKQLSKYEMILKDLGYNPLEFKFSGKTMDNLSFIQKSSGKILDLWICGEELLNEMEWLRFKT